MWVVTVQLFTVNGKLADWMCWAVKSGYCGLLWVIVGILSPPLIFTINQLESEIGLTNSMGGGALPALDQFHRGISLNCVGWRVKSRSILKRVVAGITKCIDIIMIL